MVMRKGILWYALVLHVMCMLLCMLLYVNIMYQMVSIYAILTNMNTPKPPNLGILTTFGTPPDRILTKPNILCHFLFSRNGKSDELALVAFPFSGEQYFGF